MFVEPAYRQSPEYRAFWQKLGRGEFDAGQYKRLGKGGREIWIQASYNPIMDASGKPFKVVKYATDITAQVLADQALKLAVQQTQEVLAATKDNDLTQRIPLEGETGEIATLCSGINGLLDTMVLVISDIRQRRARSPTRPPRSRPAPPICLSAPRSRPRASRRRPPRWKRCPPR